MHYVWHVLLLIGIVSYTKNMSKKKLSLDSNLYVNISLYKKVLNNNLINIPVMQDSYTLDKGLHLNVYLCLHVTVLKVLLVLRIFECYVIMEEYV